ncbi:voltage-dependent T-type calcium channel subunit alpha-1H-like isoform X4 [Corythoichthys intestinalis]|nr:voltage-dependent T-type calcium channel subunit alpha-1H-like isoform X4 [Corythoichthys intestinalis]
MTSEEEEDGPSTAATIARVNKVNDVIDPSSPHQCQLHKEEGKGEEEKDIEEEEVDCDDDEDDGSSATSVLVVPYPELVPVVFFCLKQTTCPRSWCIRMVSNPYPFFVKQLKLALEDMSYSVSG